MQNRQDRAWVATRKGLFEFRRGASGWSIAAVDFIGDPVNLTLLDPRDGALYAALDLGHFGVKLHRRDAGAATWEEIAVPAYPPQPDSPAPGQALTPGAGKDEVAWKLALIWSLETGGRDEPGTLWAGTLPGGLFRSRDRGASWELMRSLWDRPERREWFGGGKDTPGIHSICVDPRNAAHLVIGVSCGGAWTTRDGGATWALTAKGMRAAYMPPEQAGAEQTQDPHRIVQCAAVPDTLWCQHHNGIWRSTNGGELWAECTNTAVANFGFAVAVHPRDAGMAWFVPAIKDEKRYPVDGALCVTRTRDGGKSFEALRKGLPQQHCYDLVYRHGLAVTDDGATLMMGSTTGGLWVSEDGGDAWATLSNTLPPVYAVAFG